MKNQRGDGILSFHHSFDIWRNLDGGVVSSTCCPPFTPKEIPLYSFLLEAEWSPGLLNADGRNGPLKFSKDLPRIEHRTPCLGAQYLSQLSIARPVSLCIHPKRRDITLSGEKRENGVL